MQLVGRDAVLAELGATLDAAAAGRGGVVVIAGEPGIGKSALCDALVARAAGMRASYGRSWEFADAPPYFPLRPALRALGIDADAAPDPFALWERVLDRLALAAAAAPQLWIVEDVHAADLGTLDLLAFLARPVRSLAAAIVVTRRDRDPRLTEAAEQRLVRIAREGHAVALAPLGADDVARIAERAAGRALAAPARARLVELTGGNPLFVVECARRLRSGDDAATLPDTLRRVVLDRIELLGAATRDALAAAAVLGRDVSALAIGRVLDRLPARVIDLLGPALRAGVLVETAPGEYTFSHAIVRDVVEDALAPAARAELHAAAARALASLPSSPDRVVERARHALAALAGAAVPDAPAIVAEAIAYLGERGAADRAFALASELARVRDAGLVPPATLDERLQLAQLAFAAGRVRDGQAICETVLADARRAGDAVALARGALALGSELRPAVVDTRLVGALEEAAAALGDREPALRCRVDARLAAARQPAADRAGPIRLAEAAIATARALGDRALLCEVIDVGGSAMVDMVPLAQRLALSSELVELGAAVGDRPRELRGRVRRAVELVERGDFAAVADEVDAALALSRELGEPRYRWRPLLLASLRALAEGRANDSECALVEAEQLQAVTDDPALARAVTSHGGTRALQLSRFDEVERRIASLEAVPDMPGAALFVAAVRAEVHAELGNRAAAAAQLAHIGAAFPYLARTNIRVSLLAPTVLAGSEAQRRALHDAFSEHDAPELVAGNVTIIYAGPKLRALGLLAAALGELRTGEAQLREALALARARGHALWIARIAYELGALVGDRALLAEAAALAADIGMPGLLARIAPASAPAAARALAVVREGDVWRVTSGATTVRIKHSRGLELLARLVARPDEEIHVLALASDDPSAALHDRGEPVLDDRARRDYRRRLAELDAAIADAEDRGDDARYAALERERGELADELARAAGLGGKPRRAGAISERARTSVQRRLKDAIARIAEADGELGRYLERAVRTGTYCCFRP